MIPEDDDPVALLTPDLAGVPVDDEAEPAAADAAHDGIAAADEVDVLDLADEVDPAGELDEESAT